MPQPVSTEHIIRALENRIQNLEKALQLSANKIILQAGMSKIVITQTGVTVESAGKILIKADGDLILKGSKIQEN
jgi:hypothetical protein